MTESTILLNQLIEIYAQWCGRYYDADCKGCPAKVGACLFSVCTDLLMERESWLSQFINDNGSIITIDGDYLYN